MDCGGVDGGRRPQLELDISRPVTRWGQAKRSTPATPPPNDQGKRTGQAARETTGDQRSQRPSQTETPPLGRVRLNRLLGILWS